MAFSSQSAAAAASSAAAAARSSSDPSLCQELPAEKIMIAAPMERGSVPLIPPCDKSFPQRR